MSLFQSPFLILGGSSMALSHLHIYGRCCIDPKSCSKGLELSKIVRQGIGFEGVVLASVALSAELAREHLGGQEGEELAHAIAGDTAKRVSQAMRMREGRENLPARLPDRIHRQRKLRKAQREANEAQKVLAQLRAETAERSETQEGLSFHAFDGSATSSSSRDEREEEEDEEKEHGESMSQSIGDVRHQTSFQQKENLLAIDGFEVEVDMKEDLPPLSTRRSGRSKAPSRKIQSQQRRDLEKKTAKEIKAAQKKRCMRKGGKAKCK
ncbi:MAG: hypothetical protein M1839_007193 [Geoglossum umbratile]|nr:MAG: hypothetical protein M1839_007193 [Geoglossum umbratile]